MIEGIRPRLGPGVRLAIDPLSGGSVLLGPESVRFLTGSAGEILKLCDGSRSVPEIASTLDERYQVGFERIFDEIMRFLADLAEHRDGPESLREGPTGLLAELTHRCPLRCGYCSNPIDPPTGRGELDGVEWSRALAEAASLGVLQVHFSGGEPLIRADVPDLIASARSVGLYTNLITSGLGLDRVRAEQLREAGLDHVQVSFQADEPTLADAIAGISAHGRKLEAARAVARAGIALTINVVLHRGNLDRLPLILELAESLGPGRIELAHAQYYGWAWQNRGGLIPTRTQVDAAAGIAEEAGERLRGRVEIIHVVPDYFGDRPKPCMNGWGRRQLTVDPVGDVLPCPTSRSIPSLRFDNIRDRPLGEIWRDSEAFNRFRGTAWMPEPCQSCDLREVDFGGCRCQAALLTGDAFATDPACSLSPHRESLMSLLDSPATHDLGLVMRRGPAFPSRLAHPIGSEGILS
jgi:pyrroloquinoline quinone biosynthesis protein E